MGEGKCSWSTIDHFSCLSISNYHVSVSLSFQNPVADLCQLSIGSASCPANVVPQSRLLQMAMPAASSVPISFSLFVSLHRFTQLLSTKPPSTPCTAPHFLCFVRSLRRCVPVLVGDGVIGSSSQETVRHLLQAALNRNGQWRPLRRVLWRTETNG